MTDKSSSLWCPSSCTKRKKHNFLPWESPWTPIFDLWSFPHAQKILSQKYTNYSSISIHSCLCSKLQQTPIMAYKNIHINRILYTQIEPRKSDKYTSNHRFPKLRIINNNSETIHTIPKEIKSLSSLPFNAIHPRSPFSLLS